MTYFLSPFTMRVYWDLLKAKEKCESVASSVQINPELLTVQGMVGVMFGVDAVPQA